MKVSYRALLSLLLLIFSVSGAFAQTTDQVNDLIREGNILQGHKQYDEAIAKFNEVLKLDPENANASYQIGYTLFAANKPMDAIPYLEKVVKSPKPGLVVASYSLMGTIYDQGHQPQKSIEAFNQAIKLAPGYPEIYYNLGLAYSRNQQYTEAETAAIEAIKHDVKHKGSQRLYALACFHQNKRVEALLGFCSFILLDPTSALAKEAYGNIQHILQGGVLKTAGVDSKETIASNAAIAAVVASAKTKKLTGTDLVAYELKGIFTMAGQLAAKKTDKSFNDKFFADYFFKLSQSDNMSAFTHIITQSENPEEYNKWAQANQQLVIAFTDWVKNTERDF